MFRNAERCFVSFASEVSGNNRTLRYGAEPYADGSCRTSYSCGEAARNCACIRPKSSAPTTCGPELERALRSIDRPALYIIDNIPEAAPGEDAPVISDFCPALGAVTVLATSRQDTREEGVKAVPVDTLSRDAAILLLTENVAGAARLPWAGWGRIAE
jgi:hypothetical protein